MFLTRKFSIPLCKITDNTPNYWVKSSVVHLSLLVKLQGSQWDSCGLHLHIYMYMCTCITGYVYKHMNFNESISKWNNNSGKYCFIKKDWILKIKTSILDRKFTVYIKTDVKQGTKRNEKCINSCIVQNFASKISTSIVLNIFPDFTGLLRQFL